MTQTLTGREAVEYARANDLTLSKYADPIEDERTELTVEEAEKILAEDPSLIYVEVATTGTNGYVIYPHRVGVMDINEAYRLAREWSWLDEEPTRIENCDTEKVIARFRNGEEA